MKTMMTIGILTAAALGAATGCVKERTAYYGQPVYGQQPPVIVQQQPGWNQPVVVQQPGPVVVQQPGGYNPPPPPIPNYQPQPQWNNQPPVVVQQPPVVVQQPPVVVQQPPVIVRQPPVVVQQPPVVVQQPPVVVNQPPVIVGVPGPRVGGRWVLLGQTDVEFRGDHDTIALDARQTWKRLELTAADGAIELQAVRVSFLNKAAPPYDVKVNNYVLTPKNPSVVIELPGDVRRNVTQIDFVYKSVDPKVKKAKLTVTAQ